MKKKVIIIMVIALFIVLILSGCIPGKGSYSVKKPAGFLSGIWHGWIAPASLIMGLINKNIRVYETVNSGWFYDFGFYIAIISGFGGISLFRRKDREN